MSDKTTAPDFHLFVAIKPCGCWTASIVDGQHFRDVDRYRAEWTAAGLTVERMTRAEFERRFGSAPKCDHAEAGK